MSVKIWHNDGMYDKECSFSTECVTDDKMQLAYYRLKNKESVNVVPDDYSVTSTIILLDGELKVFSDSKDYFLHPHDIIMLTDITQSYCVEALSDCKLIAVTSAANQSASDDATLSEMLLSVENKDIYTSGHSRRVSLYSKRLALAYDKVYNVITLSIAATMHDIGKINISAEILQKPSKLTNEEFNIIKKHPQDSYELLKDTIGERVALAAKQHHERLDGSGYPDGLTDSQICMDARIIAVADVFDALTCKRVYNEPMTPREAVKYIESQTNKYDPVFVNILRRKVEKGEMDDILTAFV